MLSVERKRPMFEGGTSVVSCMGATIVHKHRFRKPPHLLSHYLRKHEVEVCREKRNARVRSQSEYFNRPPCEYFLKGTCTKSPCECWHPPECQFFQTKSGCKVGAECSFPHWKVEEQPNKKPKKYEGKSAVAIVKKCTTVELCTTGH